VSASAAIQELRTRIQNAGYPVTMWRVVDPETDTLPIAAINFADDGEQWEADSPLDRVQSLIDVMLVAEYDSEDPELEAVQEAETFRDLLVERVPDKRDTLADSVSMAYVDNMFIGTRQESTNVFAIFVRVRLEYQE